MANGNPPGRFSSLDLWRLAELVEWKESFLQKLIEWFGEYAPMRFGETYLANPDLFPTRESGDPWGDRQVTIHLPGGPYRFSGLNDSQEATVRERFGVACLAADDGPRPSVQVEVLSIPGSHFLEMDRRGWTYDLDLECKPTSLRIAGLDFLGRLDWNPTLSGALWTPKDTKEFFPGAFENFFRILFSYRLLECGGAMIHSACVVDDGEAYLFVGTSGAGKSTISRLSLETGRSVLSDDLNALSVMKDGSVVEKLPFTGDLGPSTTELASYPLRAICRLQKGEKNEIQSISRAEAIASLVTCSPNVNVNPYRQDHLVANLQSLTRSVPTRVLTFSMDGDFWELLTNNSGA